MLETTIRYLRNAEVPFRLSSYPAPEALPEIGHPLPRGAILVDVRLVEVDGRPALACAPHGARMDLGRLGLALDAVVEDAPPELLPQQFAHAGDAIPPLGGLLGVPLFVDEALEGSSWIVFRCFSRSDFVELSYEDFVRVEQPRVVPFAGGGALPAHVPRPRVKAVTKHAAARKSHHGAAK